VWWPGNKNSPTVTHTCRKRRLKWVPGAWGCNWATLPLGDINTEAWSSGMGVGRGDSAPWSRSVGRLVGSNLNRMLANSPRI
jgi:hypothetical protein